jgi:hypothetical protein
MKLFDDIVRTEVRFMLPGESHFEYHNISNRPFIAWYRDAVEKWFADYPECASKNELRGNFRSKDDKQHRGALFQLIIHAFLRAMDYEVDPGPTLPRGSTPDFHATKDGFSFYVEATAAGPSEETAQIERYRNDIENVLERIRPTNIRFDLTYESCADKTPDIKALKSQVLSWLPTARIDTEEPPQLDWSNSGWSIQIAALREDAPNKRAVRFKSIQVTIFDDAQRICKAVRKKASQHDTSDTPYIIAVNCWGDPIDDIDIMEGIFGKEEYTYAVGPDDKIMLEGVGRKPNGVFYQMNGLVNTRVSAVFLCCNTSPGELLQNKAVLIHHPKARNPIPIDNWPTSQFVPDRINSRLVPRPGKTIGEVMKLPEPWPPTKE